MSHSFEEKLEAIFSCIEATCLSSIKLFKADRGHKTRSVGLTAYDERQKRFLDLAESMPNILQFHCRRGQYDYFKFEGKTLKVISSTRQNLSKSVFDRNVVERDDEEFTEFDPLIRIIYKADYDLIENTATILECYYIEVDRNTHQVLKEVNVLRLARDEGGMTVGIKPYEPEPTDLPPASLLSSIRKQSKKSDK